MWLLKFLSEVSIIIYGTKPYSKFKILCCLINFTKFLFYINIVLSLFDL